MRGANRNIQYVIAQLDDRSIDAYTSADICLLRCVTIRGSYHLS